MILSGSFEEYTFVLFHYPVIKRDPIICQTFFQRFEDQFILSSVHQHQIDDPVCCHSAYRVDRLLFLVTSDKLIAILWTAQFFGSSNSSSGNTDGWSGFG